MVIRFTRLSCCSGGLFSSDSYSIYTCLWTSAYMNCKAMHVGFKVNTDRVALFNITHLVFNIHMHNESKVFKYAKVMNLSFSGM